MEITSGRFVKILPEAERGAHLYRLIAYYYLGELKVLLLTAGLSLPCVIRFMNKLMKFRIYSAVVGGLVLAPIAAHAQASPAATTGATTTADATGTDVRGDRTEHHDYGWIGLAGLLGLAGLMGRKRDDRYDTTRRSDQTGRGR